MLTFLIWLLTAGYTAWLVAVLSQDCEVRMPNAAPLLSRFTRGGGAHR